jgi:hypothetical protein
MLNFNQFYVYLIYILLSIPLFKAWQWKFTQLYIYNVLFLKVQRNSGLVSFMLSVCPSKMGISLDMKIF